MYRKEESCVQGCVGGKLREIELLEKQAWVNDNIEIDFQDVD